MNPLRPITRAFIDVFGITRPTPQQEQRATRFITALLALVIVLFFGTVYMFLHGSHR